jgi:hypothetical protein
VKQLATTRGFTVVAPLHLDYIDASKFKPNSFSVNKKYGLFPCTSGHVSLKINVGRSAYLCGESIVLEGHVNNETNKRVDRVVGVMQKIVEIMGYSASGPKMVGSCEKPTLSTISTEVINVREENLAMFVDARTTTKITKNFAVPTCRPSSFEDIHVGHYLVNVSYRLIVQVRQISRH